MVASNSPATGPVVSTRTELLQLAVLLAWFAGAAVLGAGRDVPVIDDWTYAWSVEQLLTTGRFDVLEFSAVYPFAPAVWGAAWSSWLGFSFVTLRLSTLVLGFLAVAAVYLLLRELRASKHIALLGGFVVAANPMFYLLASSFMTDVPFVACTMMALLCYVRAGSRGRASLVWWAGFWALAALLTRQVGIITPVAGLPLLFRSAHRDGSLAGRHVIVALVTTWIVMALSLWALTSIVGPTYVMTEANEKVRYVVWLSAMDYLVANLNLMTSIGFHALPAFLAMASTLNLWRSRKLWLMGALGSLILVAAVGEVPQPLKPGNIWSVRELGLARGLVGGQLVVDPPVWLSTALRGAGLLAVALALTRIVPGVRWPSPLSIATILDAGRRLLARAWAALTSAASAPIVIYLGGYLAIVNVLWFYHDRYLVPLLFAFVILALGRQVTADRTPVLAWAMVAVFAVTAVVGTYDTLRFNEAVRDSSSALVARGVPQSDIDAGYSWNGWMLYAHPKNLAKGLDPSRDVPWISTRRALPYMLATSPVKDYVVERVITWDDLSWPNPDRLFVLRRGAPGTARTPRNQQH